LYGNEFNSDSLFIIQQMKIKTFLGAIFALLFSVSLSAQTVILHTGDGRHEDHHRHYRHHRHHHDAKIIIAPRGEHHDEHRGDDHGHDDHR